MSVSETDHASQGIDPVVPVPFDEGAGVSPELHGLACKLKWSRLFRVDRADAAAAGAALLMRTGDEYRLKFDTTDVAAARALAEHASALLARIGHQRMRCWETVKEASTELEFLISAGFDPGPVSTRFTMRTTVIRDALRPLVDMLKTRGKLPEKARVVSLATAVRDGLFEDVSALEKRFVGNRAMLLQEHASGEDGLHIHHALSRVAVLDSAFVAIVLGRPIASDTFLVEARAVAPEHRNRWVNPCMMLDGVEGLLTAGLTAIELDATEANADTLGLARKGDAVTLRRVCSPTYHNDTARHA
ncbi:MAG: hypothetical protein AAF968_05795 [Pseudomonadota bacterium]